MLIKFGDFLSGGFGQRFSFDPLDYQSVLAKADRTPPSPALQPQRAEG